MSIRYNLFLQSCQLTPGQQITKQCLIVNLLFLLFLLKDQILNDLISPGLSVCILYLNDSSRLRGVSYVSESTTGWTNLFAYSSARLSVSFTGRSTLKVLDARIAFNAPSTRKWPLLLKLLSHLASE